jgi:transposase
VRQVGRLKRVAVEAYVDEGHERREAARHFCVSPRFVNELMKLRRETGSLEPRRLGPRAGGGKLAPHAAFVRRRMIAAGELTPDELCVELEGRGASVDSNVGRLLHRLGLSHKKTLQASEQQRANIREARELLIKRRTRFFAKALPRLGRRLITA